VYFAEGNESKLDHAGKRERTCADDNACSLRSSGLLRVGAIRQVAGSSDELDRASAAEITPLAENYCIRGDCISRRAKGPTNGEPSDLWSDIHRLKHNSRRVDHPCQLPPALMRRLFAVFTRPGEVVLDCFNGAGTSTLVAEQMGRQFIGIELSPQYHALATERHEALRRGDDPFGKDDSVPKAKNSRVQRMPKQRYSVSKKELQLDVRRIARELGKLPTREDVSALSKFPAEYFDQYFASWGEVCAAARTTGMSEYPPEDTLESQLALTLEFARNQRNEVSAG